MPRERRDTHWDAGHNWALVLAGGEGTRLQSLTRLSSGICVPKQFCSLGHSDILQRSTDSLRVLRVPACGWSDLGTPHRVIETVRQVKSQAGGMASSHTDPSAFLNLAGRTPAMYAAG